MSYTGDPNYVPEDQFIEEIPENLQINVEIQSDPFGRIIKPTKALEAPKPGADWVDNKPLHKLNDIVYLLSNADYGSGSSDYPCLNCKYEIDCKVVGVHEYTYEEMYKKCSREKTLKCYYYNLVSGKGKQIGEVQESYIVAAKNKHLFKDDKFKTLIEDTELAPEGAVFVLKDDYYSSDKHGVYIHKDRLKQVNHLFK